jgi:hypothetical protein
MDDHDRITVYRSVYGFPALNKYTMEPAKPIRISVQNGNVTLYGVVDYKADKDVAVSKRIIVKHNGTLRFRTSQRPDGCGTSFRITLPLTSVNRPEHVKMTV